MRTVLGKIPLAVFYQTCAGCETTRVEFLAPPWLLKVKKMNGQPRPGVRLELKFQAQNYLFNLN